ncbi:hypothetical protein BaRGS_00038225 [Batillaria attramentaria]|uniref:Uncharacterized protein n=1 Tax=Batillaria attramentaria TaxID=370345 RepID=A0ABD0J6C3_9CAEN
MAAKVLVGSVYTRKYIPQKRDEFTQPDSQQSTSCHKQLTAAYGETVGVPIKLLLHELSKRYGMYECAVFECTDAQL